MKPSEYREHFDMSEKTYFARECHEEFCNMLEADFLNGLEFVSKTTVDGVAILTARQFKGEVQKIRQKFDSIFNNVKGDYEKLWSYFYAKRICDLGRIHVPEFKKTNEKFINSLDKR